MKLHPKIQQEIRQVTLQWPALPQAEKIPVRLQGTIVAYCARDANRDGRGLRCEARETVARTLKHIRSAERVAVDGSSAEDLAKRARSLLKSLKHNTDFDRTVHDARRFAGELQKAGRRRRRVAKVCRPQEHSCGTMEGVGEIRLCRVASADQLYKIGRKLRLCVAKGDRMSREYFSDLRTQEVELWTLCKCSAPFALLSVSEEDGSRFVTEFQGFDNSEPAVTDEDGRHHEIPRQILRKVLGLLNADAPDIECFTRAGVFRSLLSDAALGAHAEVCIYGERWRVWKFPDEIIMVSGYGFADGHHAIGERWSRFIRKASDTRPAMTRLRRARHRARRIGPDLVRWQEGVSHDDALDVGSLLELVLASRDLHAVLYGVNLPQSAPVHIQGLP